MIIDTLNEFSDAQSLIRTTAAGALPSTNVLDLGASKNQPVGSELYLHIKILATVVGAGASIEFKLETDANDAFSSAATKFTTGALAITGLAAKTEVARIRVPAGMERYARLTYTPTGANVTAGSVDAFLTPSVDEQGAVN